MDSSRTTLSPIRHLEGQAASVPVDDLASHLLDAFSVATFVVDAGTRILVQNRSANHLLSRSNWLERRDERLALRHTVPTLATMLKLGSSSGEMRRIAPPAKQGEPELLVRRLSGSGLWLILAHEAVPALPWLQRRFGLTPAETTLASALSNGTPQADVAVQLGVSVNTVKSQAKALYAKVGVSRQSELVWLMASAPECLLDVTEDPAPRGRR